MAVPAFVFRGESRAAGTVYHIFPTVKRVRWGGANPAAAGLFPDLGVNSAPLCEKVNKSCKNLYIFVYKTPN